MFFGTLLGSYMSHAILPWDDDMDIVVYHKDMMRLNKLHQAKLLRTEQNLGMATQCVTWPGPKMPIDRNDLFTNCKILKLKIYDGIYTPGTYPTQWNWPFLDVIAYDFNSTHAWIIEHKEYRTFLYHDFFPFSNRPFGGLWLPAPRNPRDTLAHAYRNSYFGDKFTCTTSNWDHLARKGITPKTVPCRQLVPYFPFVHRHKRASGEVVETLHIGNISYYSIVTKEPYEATWQPKPYHLLW
jgi:hypothetical protein